MIRFMLWWHRSTMPLPERMCAQWKCNQTLHSLRKSLKTLLWNTMSLSTSISLTEQTLQVAGNTCRILLSQMTPNWKLCAHSQWVTDSVCIGCGLHPFPLETKCPASPSANAWVVGQSTGTSQNFSPML